MVRGRFQECERTRRSISAALDGELSEFESMLLGAHLAGCDTCREFEASAQLSTTALRAAPLEPLRRPVELPSKQRRGLGLRVPSAAAAATLMVVLGGVFESFHGGAPNPSGSSFDNNADIRAIAKRQQQANFDQLLARRALYESNRIPRLPGFQNP